MQPAFTVEDVAWTIQAVSTCANRLCTRTVKFAGSQRKLGQGHARLTAFTLVIAYRVAADTVGGPTQWPEDGAQ